jgi:acrylyl-CoA reductase (NADPH)
MFKALTLNKDTDGKTLAALGSSTESDLPEGNVLVRVAYSSLNYKDGLAITGRSPVVRKFPMVPGIDFAGTVLESSQANIKPGDEVILNGWGVGESHWGGLAERARVKGDWLVPMPAGMDAKRAMAIGTAGYTSMLCVMALQDRGVRPEHGPVLVTGANGGVGTIAISLLANLGFSVHASTGRLDDSAYLKSLGASEIIERSELGSPGKPLQKERWAAAIDSVGSHTLANVCASLRYGGTVAACGLAQGMDFPSSMAPFILRGIALLGIDSVNAPMERRIVAWHRLATELPGDVLDANTRTIGLAAVRESATELLAGNVRGRLVVDLSIE